MFERLAILREKNKLTQKELGKILNVDRSVISKWENGSVIIPLEKLNEYSNFFHVSLDYLTGLSNQNNYQKNHTLNKNIIGNNLKRLRQKNNLTLRNLAKELNTTSSTISAYEMGKTLILTSFAYQLAKKYQISLDTLFTEK